MAEEEDDVQERWQAEGHLTHLRSGGSGDEVVSVVVGVVSKTLRQIGQK